MALNNKTISTRQLLSLGVLLILIVGYFLYNVFSQIPTIWLGGDAVTKWELAKALCVGSEHAFNVHNHHHLRWGSWWFAWISCKFAGTSPIVYYISSILPMWLAIILFVFSYIDIFGLWVALIVLFLWVIHPYLNYVLYQLMPTSQALVWLVVSLILLHKLSSSKSDSLALMFLVSISLFMLYACKLPFAFFIPGALFICYQKNFKTFFIVTGLLAFYYLVETGVFYYLSEGEYILGRLQALTSSTNQHINSMDSYSIQKELSRYKDGGIFIRWSTTRNATDFLIYMLVVAFSILFLSFYKNKLIEIISIDKDKKQILFIISVLTISFFIFTTYFIISIFPVKIAQPLRSRYLTILLPFAFIFIALFLQLILNCKPRILLVVAITWLLAFIMPLYYDLTTPRARIDTLFEANQFYTQINNKPCIKSTADKYKHMASLIYKYWDDTSYLRIRRDAVVNIENGRKRLYVPAVCNDPYFIR